ncbi:hypothetical protein NA78x_005992 [Anatilimnocola sp. NA78]|uniref:hypothetical protein n=1 Tax=Anatilimnocola sp. NA78 TaxID=3415683 RepID=UPI003CE45020
MICRAALLLSILLLVGCQNAPEQLSLYAPFGPAVVPQPALSRANSTPYYTPPAASTGSSPATANSPNGNKLSHYDPHTGVLVPGSFTPPAIASRSVDLSSDSNALASGSARTRPSTEEAIKIVETDSSPRGLSSAISSGITQATRSSSGVKFQASPPSGVVRTGSALLPPAENPISIAAVPRSATSRTTAPAIIPTTRSSTAPVFGTPGLLAPPPAAQPATGQPVQPGVIPAKPAESRRLSLWDAGDGSRVMPAAHLEEGDVITAGPSSWRAR